MYTKIACCLVITFILILYFRPDKGRVVFDCFKDGQAAHKMTPGCEIAYNSPDTRSSFRRIYFNRPFLIPPTVQANISGMDVTQCYDSKDANCYPSSRTSVEVKNVNCTSFDVDVITWYKSAINSIALNWVALP